MDYKKLVRKVYPRIQCVSIMSEDKMTIHEVSVYKSMVFFGGWAKTKELAWETAWNKILENMVKTFES